MNAHAFVYAVALAAVGSALPSRGLAQPSLPEPVFITAQQSSILLASASSVKDRLKEIGRAFSLVERNDEWSKVQQGLVDLTNREEKFVISTQEAFDKASSSENGRRASTAYFGDIRHQYADTRTQIGRTPSGREEYRGLKNAIVDLYEKTAVAYAAVATSGRTTFDLRVESEPRSATVTLRRAGDKPENNPSPTNTIVKNLPMAQWYVKVELAGYLPQEKMHDPFRESEHLVDFLLQKK